MAFVLGAVLASTDPVAVTALGRRLSLPPRVQALVQAESLFNDATSLLLFRVALSLAVTAGAVSWSHTLTEFAVLAGGGLLVGALAAGGAFLIRRRTEDPVLETVVSLVTPYAAYVAAESVGGSGVTAVVVASIILGTQASRLTTAAIRLQLGAVFGTVVFLLESVVFGLIGLQLPALVRRLAAAGEGTAWLLPALAIAGALVVVRVAWVFPLAAFAQRRGGRRPSWQVPAVVTWAGARGVVPLAAALSIPLTTSAGALLPYRDLVLALSIAVIVITLVVQGFTLAPLVRRAGIALDPQDVDEEHSSARARLAEAGLAHLDELAEREAAPEFAIDQLRHSWQARLDRILSTETDQAPATSATYRELRRDLLAAEGAELARLYETGAITDATRRRIQRTLDLENTRLNEE
jgi:CPA1 family monovalent cation:H+ antiporter